MDIRSSYDAAAAAYAAHLSTELDHKPLDRHLLNRFAESVAGQGLVAELGCGPGHVARYLADRGVEMCGVDLSPEMVRCASEASPTIAFRVGDMSALDFADAQLAGIVAFYAIVHLSPNELAPLFREWRRVLRTDGLLLLAFHAGTDTVHVDELFGCAVSLEFQFHEPRAVADALESSGFAVAEWVERAPYDGVEYASRRCYLVCRVSKA